MDRWKLSGRDNVDSVGMVGLIRYTNQAFDPIVHTDRSYDQPNVPTDLMWYRIRSWILAGPAKTVLSQD